MPSALATKSFVQYNSSLVWAVTLTLSPDIPNLRNKIPEPIAYLIIKASNISAVYLLCNKWKNQKAYCKNIDKKAIRHRFNALKHIRQCDKLCVRTQR